jgi:hypothetical protein
MRVVKCFLVVDVEDVMGFCRGCVRVLSSYALFMAWVQTQQSLVRADVMCVVYCVIPECVGGYCVVITHWKAWMEFVSKCPPQVQGMRSPLVIVAPLAFTVVHCSRRLCMRVLMCWSVLLSAWVRCVYVVWVHGVIAGLFGDGCVGAVGLWVVLLGRGSVV